MIFRILAPCQLIQPLLVAASGKQIAFCNLRPYPVGIRLSEGATASKALISQRRRP